MCTAWLCIFGDAEILCAINTDVKNVQTAKAGIDAEFRADGRRLKALFPTNAETSVVDLRDESAVVKLSVAPTAFV